MFFSQRRQSLRYGIAILMMVSPLGGCSIVNSSHTATFYSPTSERNLSSIDKTTVTLPDTVRNKKLPLNVVYPTSFEEQSPVVIFSYGHLAAGDQDKILADYWTSNGYVVITPAHDDSPYRDGSKYNGLDNELLWENRIKDITLVLDSLGAIEQDLPEFQGVLDSENVALAGFSVGAHTTSLMAGATVETSAEANANYQDNRLKAFLALSPQGRGSWTGFDNDSWDNLNKPIMFFTGSQDTQASLGASNIGPEWRAEGYTFSPPGDKYYFVIEGFSHMDFDGSEPERGRRNRLIYNSIRSVSLAFFDSYLKDSETAKEYLSSNQLAEETESLVRLQLK